MRFQTFGRLTCGRCGQKHEFEVGCCFVEDYEDDGGIHGWRDVSIEGEDILLCPPCQAALKEWVKKSKEVNRVENWTPKNPNGSMATLSRDDMSGSPQNRD